MEYISTEYVRIEGLYIEYIACLDSPEEVVFAIDLVALRETLVTEMRLAV